MDPVITPLVCRSHSATLLVATDSALFGRSVGGVGPAGNEVGGE